jgi:hypothetical protein
MFPPVGGRTSRIVVLKLPGLCAGPSLHLGYALPQSLPDSLNDHHGRIVTVNRESSLSNCLHHPIVAVPKPEIVPNPHSQAEVQPVEIRLRQP